MAPSGPWHTSDQLTPIVRIWSLSAAYLTVNVPCRQIACATIGVLSPFSAESESAKVILNTHIPRTHSPNISVRLGGGLFRFVSRPLVILAIVHNVPFLWSTAFEIPAMYALVLARPWEPLLESFTQHK